MIIETFSSLNGSLFCLAVRMDFVSSSTTHPEQIFVQISTNVVAITIFVSLEAELRMKVPAACSAGLTDVHFYASGLDSLRKIPYLPSGEAGQPCTFTCSLVCLVLLLWEGFFPHYLLVDIELCHGEREAHVPFYLFFQLVQFSLLISNYFIFLINELARVLG